MNRRFFEEIYKRHNKRGLVSPDPLVFLYDYPGAGDREIAGLVASSLAYGRVAQILKSAGAVLSKMGPPREYVMTGGRARFEADFKDFKHRFTTGADIAALLDGVRSALMKFGSVENLFHSCLKEKNSGMAATLDAFATRLMGDGGGRSREFLLPKASRGGSCKRLNLYLRWMVRHDEVDPGGWTCVSPSVLLVPLDTHMFDVCRRLGFTKRKSADFKAVLEITARFREICPEDPVRYDFAITRFGIRADMDKEDFFAEALKEPPSRTDKTPE